MKTLRYWGLRVMLLCFIAIMLISCSDGGIKERCRDGNCLTMQLEEPIVFGQPTTVTLTVSTEEALSDLDIRLNSTAADMQFLPQGQWLVDTQENKPIVVTSTVVFPEKEGHYTIISGILHPSIYLDTSIWVHLTKAGGVVNPTLERPFKPESVEPVTTTIHPPTSFLPTPNAPSSQEDSAPFEAGDVIGFTDPHVISGDIANLDPARAETVLPGEVVAHGAFYYYERDDTQVPAAYIRVLLYDADLSGVDDLLTSTITGADGTWQVGPLPNWDDDAAGALDLYAVFETQVEGEDLSYRQVTGSDKYAYQWQIPTVVDVSDGFVDLGSYSLAENSLFEPAMWIFQDLRRAWAYVYNFTGDDAGAVAARWERGRESLSWCDGSCCCPAEFVPCAAIAGIFIADGSVSSEDVVVHEVGHQYMVNAMGFWFGPPNTWDDFNACVIQNHDFFDVKTELCAWTEGWAHFLTLAVHDDPLYTRGGGGVIDLEQPTWGDGLAVGDMVEGRIAGALYDIFDNTDDGYDQVCFGFNPIWEVFTTLPEEDTFTDFWESWQNSGHNQHLAVQAIYQNTIVYNTLPTLQIPDGKILQGFDYDQAVDLWEYSHDVESHAWELAWTLNSVSDWHCGVGLDPQGYVSARPPDTGWLGGCDVEIQVADGISTTVDSFNLQVVPVAARIYVPAVGRGF